MSTEPVSEYMLDPARLPIADAKDDKLEVADEQQDDSEAIFAGESSCNSKASSKIGKHKGYNIIRLVSEDLSLIPIPPAHEIVRALVRRSPPQN